MSKGILPASPLQPLFWFKISLLSPESPQKTSSLFCLICPHVYHPYCKDDISKMQVWLQPSPVTQQWFHRLQNKDQTPNQESEAHVASLSLSSELTLISPLDVSPNTPTASGIFLFTHAVSLLRMPFLSQSTWKFLPRFGGFRSGFLSSLITLIPLMGGVCLSSIMGYHVIS